MSDSERAKAEGAEELALVRLEEAVRRFLDDRRLLAEKADEAGQRVRELEGMLAGSCDGVQDFPLGARLERLERENESLRRTVAEGRVAVEGLLARMTPQ